MIWLYELFEVDTFRGRTEEEIRDWRRKERRHSQLLHSFCDGNVLEMEIIV